MRLGDCSGYPCLGELAIAWRKLADAVDHFGHGQRAGYVAVSAISCFEVSLLVKRGKLELPLPIDEWLPEALGNSGIDRVPVSCEIARLSVSLQDVHKDPADRIIIATVLAHDAFLATLDVTFPAYAELAGRLVSR